MSGQTRVEHRGIEAAADEDGVRLFERRQRRGRCSRDNARSCAASPKASALARMLAARSSRASIAIDVPPASAHSIEIEPEPAPMSHSRLARPRRQRRQRQRADRPLGDLAVVLEEIVGKAGRARQSRRALGFNRDSQRRGCGRLPRSPSPRLSLISSRGPPSADIVQSLEAPHPRASSHRARSVAAAASRSRQMIRAPRASSGTSRSKGAA